ncbi:MAG: GntR family transcriptional regulator [Roseibium sp.]|nr:GntR family transcriptional regulator [Roseibium sp.]
MTNRALTRQSLPDVIARDVRERILSGELSEGETIRQDALAEDYAVSRMPVREALKRLDAEGLVQFYVNRGAVVTKHSLAEIGEIFDVRLLLEVDLFRRSIPDMTETHVAQCAQLLDELDASYDADDVGRWGMLNSRFHQALYAAAERPLTNDLLHRVNLQCDRYVRMHLSVLNQKNTAKQEHRDLLKFSRAGKVDAACDLLTRHITETKRHLLDLIAAKRGHNKKEVGA